MTSVLRDVGPSLVGRSVLPHDGPYCRSIFNTRANTFIGILSRCDVGGRSAVRGVFLGRNMTVSCARCSWLLIWSVFGRRLLLLV